MNKNELYTVTGCIMQISYSQSRQTEIIVGQVCKPEVVPHLLTVHGPLAAYLQARDLTDAEERYIDSVYYFDSRCELQMIEIPARKREDGPDLPAKIVGVTKAERHYRKLILFGSRRWIETANPEPMSMNEYQQFCEWFLNAERI